MNRAAAHLLAALTALLAALALAPAAAAHTYVVSSTPGEWEVVEGSPTQVSITFNENLQQTFAALTVTGPDGRQYSQGEPVVDGDTISVQVAALPTAGDYTIAFRVISADSHPVSGTIPFIYAGGEEPPADGTPGTTGGTAPADGATETSDGASDGGMGAWPYIAAIAVLAAGAGAVALRRPRRTS